MQETPSPLKSPLMLAVVLPLAILAGLGFFTFGYAEGTSYLSEDPSACANCHVMQTRYDAWEQSNHGRVATCNDCHTPHDFIGHWLAKAENGWHHSSAFTLQNYPQNIVIHERNRQIAVDNCIRCHEDKISMMMVTAQREDLDCLSCHQGIGHEDSYPADVNW